MIKVTSPTSTHLFYIPKPDEVDHAAFCRLLRSGNLEVVIELLQTKTVAASNFSAAEQFQCWISITEPRMVPLLQKHGFNLFVESPYDLSTVLEYAAEHSSAEVVQAFLSTGLFKGIIPAYKKSLPVIKAVFAPYIAYCFCETSQKPDQSIAGSFDEIIFNEIRCTFNFAKYERPYFFEKLQVLWFLTCKYKHIDERKGSFFLCLVSYLFHTVIPKEEKLERLFMANKCEHFRAVVYLLDQNGILFPHNFTEEDVFKCWTEFNAEGRAALRRYNLDVNVHIIEGIKPVYPIYRVVQNAENDGPATLCHVQDLLDAGATKGVKSALYWSRQNKLHLLTALLDEHLQNKWK